MRKCSASVRRKRRFTSGLRPCRPPKKNKKKTHSPVRRHARKSAVPLLLNAASHVGSRESWSVRPCVGFARRRRPCGKPGSSSQFNWCPTSSDHRSVDAGRRCLAATSARGYGRSRRLSSVRLRSRHRQFVLRTASRSPLCRTYPREF